MPCVHKIRVRKLQQYCRWDAYDYSNWLMASIGKLALVDLVRVSQSALLIPMRVRTSIVFPEFLSAQPAKKRRARTAELKSPILTKAKFLPDRNVSLCLCFSGRKIEPVSSDSSAHSSSTCCSIISASLFSRRPRSYAAHLRPQDVLYAF